MKTSLWSNFITNASRTHKNVPQILMTSLTGCLAKKTDIHIKY